MTEDALNQVREVVEANRQAVDATAVHDPILETIDPEPDPDVQAAKKPRRKPVKGVMAKARTMLAEGQSEASIRTALYEMYITAGRDEKNAQASAQLITHEVTTRQLSK
jgi:hypothetical protein